MYKPLPVFGSQKATNTSFLAKKGVDTRDLPQLLDTNYAKIIKNITIEGTGQLKKRSGYEIDYDPSDATIPTLRKPLFGDYDMFAYGTNLVAYNRSTGEETSIKTDFTSGTVQSGCKYADYGFVTSKSDGLWRIYQQITYEEAEQDTSGATKTVLLIKRLTGTSYASGGNVTGVAITGGTSGATATMRSQQTSSEDNTYYYGPTGTKYTTYIYVTLTGQTGPFTNGETISYTYNGVAGTAQVLQINPFVPGQKVTCGTSSANFTVLEDSRYGTTAPESGTTGILVLGALNGTPVSGESLTSSKMPQSKPALARTWYSKATTTSSVTFGIAEVEDAPLAGIVEAIADRLHLGDLVEDQYSVHYSAQDSGVNPVFSSNNYGYSWTVSSSQTGAGRIPYRNAGAVKAITASGSTPEGGASPIIVVHQENGWFAFMIQLAPTSDGTSYIKKDNVINYRLDFGGERGALMTKLGLVFANEGGIFAITSVGDKSQAYSEQITNLTQAMSDDDIGDIDFEDCDFVFDARRNYIYCTVKKGGAVYHNYMIAINCDNGALSHFEGLYVKRFSVVGNTIYGLASDQTKGYVLFTGNSDNGGDIAIEYKQEISLGSLYGRNAIQEFYTQGLLSEDQTVRIRFDIYNLEGEPLENKRSFDWSPQYSLSESEGYGEGAYGDSPYGGDSDTAAQLECFDGTFIGISNCQRLIVDYKESSALPLSLNWFSVSYKSKGPIRRRKLTKIS